MIAGLPDSGADLFILDIHMPDVDGWKLCRLLRSPELPAFNDTPILMVSATFSGVDAEEITADLGADAFLTVPYSIDDLLSFVRTLVDGAHPRKATHVLLVESDSSLRTSLAQSLEKNGFDVSITANLGEANKALAERRPDAVIMDYHLSDSSCEELLEDLRRHHGDTVVLIMTDDPDPSLSIDLLRRGADSYVRKPFDKEGSGTIGRWRNSVCKCRRRGRTPS